MSTYKAVEKWVSLPTWFGSNPDDHARFHKALEDLFAEAGTNIDWDVFKKTIKEKGSKGFLPGGKTEHPKTIEEAIEYYTNRAKIIAAYAADTQS